MRTPACDTNLKSYLSSS